MKICPMCNLRYPASATSCFVDRAQLVVAPDPWIGAVIAGKYRVEGVIGAGGMATVYRARGTSQDREVAVKMFRRELSPDPKLKERFRREATNTRRLAHRNIIEILEEGDTDDGTPFLVMEFLDGSTLEAILKGANGPLSVERSVDLMLQLAAGLARAHDFQVLHRDLKPENLFVCPQEGNGELLKILDFGIARCLMDTRLTGTGEIFGTPQYMAPERITSTESSTPADLYAVGCILFRCVTGRLPFAAQDVTSYLIQHLREKPPSPRSLNAAIPPELDALILQCLEKDPTRRPVDAHAVERGLAALAARFPRRGPFVAPTPPARSLTTPRDPNRSTTVGGMFSSLSLERWGRRTELLSTMVMRAWPGGASGDVSSSLGRLRATVTAMSEVHARWLSEQTRVETLSQRAREAQARFGHAMDALAQDLSSARQRMVECAGAVEVMEVQAARRSEPFKALHRELVAVGDDPAPSMELAGRYRAALVAMEAAMPAAEELRRVREQCSLAEAEVKDLEFQIGALRAQLDRLSQASEDETRGIQQRLERAAAELAEMEAALVRDASELTLKLRGRRELEDLFRQLEADAA